MTAAWILVVGTAVTLAVPLAWRLATRTFDPFEPIVLFALAYGVIFVVRPVAVLLRDDPRFWGVELRPTLTLAVFLAQLGAVAFVCSYELSLGRAVARRLPAPRRLRADVATRAALVVGGIGIVALLAFLPLDDPGGSLRLVLGGRSEALAERIDSTSTYLWNASLLVVPAAVVLSALAFRERSAKLAVGAAAMLGVALLRTVPLGNRMALLVGLGGLFVLAYVMRGRRPGVTLLVGVLATALVASYVIGYVRDPAARSKAGSAFTNLAHRPQYVLDPILKGPDAEMVEALSAALTVVPKELPYRWGSATVGDLLARPIPRQLWSGKPRPAGHEVVATVYPRFYPDLDPAFSPLLPLFWDFSFVGVLAGMAVFGILARALYEWFAAASSTLAAQLVFALGMWLVVIAVRNNPVDSVVLAAFLLLPVVAITQIAGRPGRVGAEARGDRHTRVRAEDATVPGRPRT